MTRTRTCGRGSGFGGYVLALENLRAVRDIATTVGVEFQGASVRFKLVGLFQPVNWAKGISKSCLGKYLAQGPLQEHWHIKVQSENACKVA